MTAASHFPSGRVSEASSQPQNHHHAPFFTPAEWNVMGTDFILLHPSLKNNSNAKHAEKSQQNNSLNQGERKQSNIIGASRIDQISSK